MNTEVVIIGAGPTGLMAACQLARFGIDFLIIDSKAVPEKRSKAMMMTARSLEIYQQMGLMDEVFRKGRIVRDISLIIKGKEVVDIALGNGGEGLTDFPFAFTLEQALNEEILTRFIQKHQKDILRETTFVSLKQQKNGITVYTNSKTNTSITAKYLIACDGAGSSVRRYLQCDFKGFTYKKRYFVADANVLWEKPYHKLIATISRKNFFSFSPMYGNQTYRVSGVVPEEFSEQENVPFKALEKVIKATVQVPFRISKVNWYTVYRLHNRCVDNFRAGRCFLAGDAAHIHSPAGGQGMNSGLQEAYNLSWKLAMVLRGFGGDYLLDTYHTERYPFAVWLLKFSNRMFRMISTGNPVISWIRFNLAPLVLRYTARTKSKGNAQSFRRIAQLWYSYHRSPLAINHSRQRLKFRAGDRFPYLLINQNGITASCYQLLTEPAFHLVHICKNEQSAKDLPYPACIPEHLKSVISMIRLPLTPEWKALGLRNELSILVRPDNYIGMLCDEPDQKLITAYFEKMSKLSGYPEK